jgi:hypothetical protein
VVWQETRTIGGQEVQVPYYLSPQKYLTPQGAYAVVLTAAHVGDYEVPIHGASNVVTVRLHVVPGISDTDMGVGFYTDYSRYAYPQNERLYFEQMAAKGCTTFTVYGWHHEGDDIARQMDLAVETGLNKFPVFACICGGPEVLQDAKRRGTHVAEWPELIGYNQDEPAESARDTVAANSATWHAGGYRTGTAIGASAWLLASLLDVCAVSMQEASPALRDKVRGAGAEWWAYDCALRGTNAPLLRYHTGLWAFVTRPRSLLFWAYMNDAHSRVNEDGTWNALRVCEFVIGTPTGPLSSVGLEGLRDGTIDYRFLRTLEDTVTAHPKNPAAPEAAAWLEKQRSLVRWDFWPDGKRPEGYWWDIPDTASAPRDLALMRTECARLLERFR